MTPHWLLCRRRRQDPSARVYCFPHSGGSPGEYLYWSDDLPEVEVWGVQLPGRGSRLDEPPVTKMADLVAALADEADFAAGCVFFGHSLGALVAYELAVHLRALGRPGPAALYVSAHEAPHLHQPDDTHLLDEAALIAAVEQRYGPLPDHIADDPEWRALLLEGLRADLEIIATYPRPDHPPLDCPIIAVGGTDDLVTEAHLRPWRDYTTGAFRLRMFPGGHFYFREHHDDVLRFLATDRAGLSR